MNAHLKLASAALLMLAVTAAAGAQSTVIVREAVDLTPEQRTIIYRSVPRAPLVVAPAEVPLTVGTPVPRIVELYDMPDTITTEVPAVRPYRYTVFGEDVVLVDPMTRQVIGVIRER